jgi:signal transduction histidine kinase
VSVSTKLWAAFLATLLLGAVVVYQLRVVSELADTNIRLATTSARVTVEGAEQLHRLDLLEEHLAKYRVTGDRRYVEQFLLVAGRFQSAVHGIDTLVLSPDERTRVVRTVDLYGEFGAGLDSLGTLVAGTGRITKGTALLDRGQQWIAALRAETTGLNEASRAAMVAAAEGSVLRARRTETTAWMLALAVLTISGLVALTVARSISLSLRRLAAGTRRVAQGEFGTRLSGARGREFRELEGDFNVMVERLSELEQMKKDFVAGVSHDLKGPLASIRMTLSVLRDEVPGPLVERQKKLLDLATRSSERLAGMVAHLLELARLEANAVPLEVRLHQLETIVGGVVAEMETRLNEKQVTPIVDCPPELTASCDGDRIGQVVQNLVENALEVAPAGSSIEIRCESESGTIRVGVADRGPGVPPELARKIFDRFVRGRRGSEGGAGLGLTICREIVEAHGGQIRVDDRPGGGSVFTFEIPADRDAAAIDIPTLAVSGSHTEAGA